MFIKSLKVENKAMGWRIEEIQFNTALTLLVGASGVGKTQILTAIESLRDIVNGNKVEGLDWHVIFSANGHDFSWEGAFSMASENGPSVVLHEQLQVCATRETLIERMASDIYFKGEKMPKLASEQSAIAIFKEETDIKEIVKAWGKVYFSETAAVKATAPAFFLPSSIEKYATSHSSLEDIKSSDAPVLLKLLLVFDRKLPVFELIKQRFIDIFPQVEDVGIMRQDSTDISANGGTVRVSGGPVSLQVFIKEHDVEPLIATPHISSGMLRTFFHLAEMYLLPKGAVVLVDEFENSLGVNCIDVLTDDLIYEGKDLQFIATSHHPYIINNVPYEYWKIVSRKGGLIYIHSASDYQLGRSKQDAFLQLTRIMERQP